MYYMHRIRHQIVTPRCYMVFVICNLTLRHVTALAVGHIQGAHKFFNMCSLCFKLYNSVEILHMRLKLLLGKLNITI